MSACPTQELFERFVKERKYLQNVSHHTVRLYRTAWKKWQMHGAEPLAFVSGLRDSGVTPEGCNIHIRSLNAFFRWAGCEPLKRLQTEDRVPETFRADDLQKLIRFRPSKRDARAHILALTLLDTGLRISEALNLTKEDIDFDSMLLKVSGKGNKQRLVPFSFELRRRLFPFVEKNCFDYVFCTREGRLLQHRNVLRDVKGICIKAKIRTPRRLLHAFRHTFATNYLRNGGSVFHLQRALGHSTLDMSRRYANLMTEDLQAMQQKVSVLQRLR